MKSKFGKYLVYFFSVLLFQELVFRTLFPLPELSNFDRAKYIAGNKEGKNYAFYRNSNWYWQSELDTAHKFVHHLNKYGFRDSEWKVKKEAKKKRVLFIGDSFLEGVMAEQNQTITEGFKSADKEQKFEVMNGGIMGVGISSYLQLMSDAIPTFKPDVVCMVLYANDLTSKKIRLPSSLFVPKEYNPLTPRLVELIIQLKKGKPIPTVFNASEKPFLPSIKDNNFPWLDKESILVLNTTAKVKNSIVDGETNPFKVNQILRSQKGLIQTPELDQLFDFMVEMRKIYATKFIVSYIPARHQITNYYYQFDKEFCVLKCPEKLDLTTDKYNQHQNYLKDICIQREVPFLDLSSPLKKLEQSKEHIYWKYDEHMKGNYYLLIGKELHRFTKRSQK